MSAPLAAQGSAALAPAASAAPSTEIQRQTTKVVMQLSAFLKTAASSVGASGGEEGGTKRQAAAERGKKLQADAEAFEAACATLRATVSKKRRKLDTAAAASSAAEPKTEGEAGRAAADVAPVAAALGAITDALKK